MRTKPIFCVRFIQCSVELNVSFYEIEIEHNMIYSIHKASKVTRIIIKFLFEVNCRLELYWNPLARCAGFVVKTLFELFRIIAISCAF